MGRICRQRVQQITSEFFHIGWEAAFQKSIQESIKSTPVMLFLFWRTSDTKTNKSIFRKNNLQRLLLFSRAPTHAGIIKF